MRRGSLILVLFGLAACPGGDAGLGDRCSDTSDCGSSLQCVAGTCAPLCRRAPECGDGYACSNQLCVLATGQVGDACHSEVDCAAGLACELAPTTNDAGQLVSSCVATTAGRPAGAACIADADCRNNLCALGRCVDLCSDTVDCGNGTSCAAIPRVEAEGAMFQGCLQSTGVLTWSLPIDGTSNTLQLPIPDSAQSVTVTMTVDDINQKVGATHVTSPGGTTLLDYNHDYYTDPVRHRPDFGQSVLAMPSTPDVTLMPGSYTVDIKSLKPPFDATSVGTATPTALAVLKLDKSVILDLHFYFLNFDEFPCAGAFNNVDFNASTAPTAAFFQNDFVGMTRQVFANNGIALGTLTYSDLHDSPELDGLDIANAAALLSLGQHATGINVFFVRSLSPVGLQAYGPNPGPAGLAKTAESGIIVALDTLCYRSWGELARLTSHELARYMGLYDNIEIDPSRTDPIQDSDYASSNLMFYSELGGTALSPGQRDILKRSGVLR